MDWNEISAVATAASSLIAAAGLGVSAWAILVSVRAVRESRRANDIAMASVDAANQSANIDRRVYLESKIAILNEAIEGFSEIARNLGRWRPEDKGDIRAAAPLLGIDISGPGAHLLTEAMASNLGPTPEHGAYTLRALHTASNKVEWAFSSLRSTGLHRLTGDSRLADALNFAEASIGVAYWFSGYTARTETASWNAEPDPTMRIHGQRVDVSLAEYKSYLTDVFGASEGEAMAVEARVLAKWPADRIMPRGTIARDSVKEARRVMETALQQALDSVAGWVEAK